MLKYFTHCFVSERMGMEKPAREFFEGCFAALPGILPEETMIIGDSLTADIAGDVYKRQEILRARHMKRALLIRPMQQKCWEKVWDRFYPLSIPRFAV